MAPWTVYWSSNSTASFGSSPTALINGQHAACNGVLIDLAKAKRRWTEKKTYYLESNTFATHDATKDSDLPHDRHSPLDGRFGAITESRNTHVCLTKLETSVFMTRPRKGLKRMPLQALLELSECCASQHCREAQQRRH